MTGKKTAVRSKAAVKVSYRNAEAAEAGIISCQMNAGYKAAYHGMMDESYLSSLTDDHWMPVIRSSLKRVDICVLAEAEGEIIGSSVFGNMPDDRDTAQLYAIYLHPDYIGKGIGHVLYEKTESQMRLRGCKYCMLEALSENKRAVLFYKKHGFIEKNTFTVHENGMSLICMSMEKSLL